MALSDIHVGQQGVIKTIQPHRLYLAELGFTPGESFRIISRAPFHGPIMIQIRGTVFALRYAEAADITC